MLLPGVGEVDGADIVVNDAWPEGMGSSLREGLLSLTERDGNEEAASASPDPLRQAESGQMIALLRQALFKLPERAREVYLLNRITGMSYSQIARHRGITAKTVEKHVARALQGLRRELGADAFGMGGDE